MYKVKNGLLLNEGKDAQVSSQKAKRRSEPIDFAARNSPTEQLNHPQIKSRTKVRRGSVLHALHSLHLARVPFQLGSSSLSQAQSASSQNGQQIHLAGEEQGAVSNSIALQSC